MFSRFGHMLFGTLRRRLILSVALVHAVLMLLFLWDVTQRQKLLILERQKEQAAALSQMLATSSAVWLATNDLAGMQELTETQTRYPELQFAMLLDLNGRVLAHSDRTRRGLYLHDLPSDPRQSVLCGKAELVDVAIPVQLAGRHLGWARVGVGQVQSSKKLAAITRDGLLYAIAAIVIGSVMAWYMGRAITRRLYTIQEVIDQVKAGNEQARITLAGTDEAAQLSAEFNSMLDTISQRVQERDLAIEQMQNSEEFLQNVVENIPDMVFVKDAQDLTFVSINKAGEDLLGIGRGELIGKKDYDFFPTDQADHFTARDRAVLDSGSMVDVQEEKIQTGDGLRMLLTKKIAIMSSKGVPRYLLGISEDITTRKQAEAVLIAAKENAEAVSRAKTAFLNMLSHELRTPLNGVMGGLQLLRMTELSAEQQEYVSMIVISAEKELALVGDLLDLTGIEAATIMAGTEPFLLRDLVQKTFEPFEASCAEKGVSLDLQIDPRLPNNLLGDRQRIAQVLSLLLSNAVKFTLQGSISVSLTMVEQSGQDLRLGLSVRDTGIGIPLAMQERIFEPFIQVDMSSTRLYGGTGMGLAICKRLLDALGGTIQVESEEGVGSFFYLELPCMVALGSAPPENC